MKSITTDQYGTEASVPTMVVLELSEETAMECLSSQNPAPVRMRALNCIFRGVQAHQMLYLSNTGRKHPADSRHLWLPRWRPEDSGTTCTTSHCFEICHTCLLRKSRLIVIREHFATISLLPTHQAEHYSLVIFSTIYFKP